MGAGTRPWGARSREQGPQAALGIQAAAGIASHLLAASSEGLDVCQLADGQKETPLQTWRSGMVPSKTRFQRRIIAIKLRPRQLES